MNRARDISIESLRARARFCLALLAACACAPKVSAPGPMPSPAPSSASSATLSTPAPSSVTSATGASSGQAITLAPKVDRPAPVVPAVRYVATRVEAGQTTYTTLDIGADGVLRGRPLGPWEATFEEDPPKKQVGSLVTFLPCAGVDPPPIVETKDDDAYHMLSMPRACASFELAPRDKTDVTLQWYGWEPNDHAIAVLRPITPKPWLLVLADTLLSPAGPWLAPQVFDLDGDGQQDVAFIAQGVDGCDRGPCPLFWIDLLMSRTHTVLRKQSAVLLTTADIEQKTGLSWEKVATLGWHSRAEAGCYEVTAIAGRRALVWSALIEPGAITVRPGVSCAVKPKSRKTPAATTSPPGSSQGTGTRPTPHS